MLDELHRLLKLHEFLNASLIEHPGDTPLSTNIRRHRDSVLFDIATLSTTDPRVLGLQVGFLIKCLSSLSRDAALADVLREACERQLQLLTGAISPRNLRADRDKTLRESSRRVRRDIGHSFACLDALTDRAAVVGRDYRYIYVNRANADYHRTTSESFIGVANWQLTGEAFFAKVNKPRLDACFAGQPMSYFSVHPGRDKVHWIKMDPLRDGAGEVVGAVAILRDASMLPVPPELVSSPP